MTNQAHQRPDTVQPEASTLSTQTSAREALRLMAERHHAVENSALGVGYRETQTGGGELVFSDLGRERLVGIPTRITRDEFEKITQRVLGLKETQFMLFELAQAYQARTPIMLEGGTAIGKTFVVNLFAKLLYGAEAQIPDFYCNGQTDTSELMGKYVPAGLKPQDHKRIQQYLASDAGAALKAEMQKDSGGVYAQRELEERAAAALGIATQQASFEFQLGVLPRAMTAKHTASGEIEFTPDGPGMMLHIQEVGTAAPSVINSLLKIRGEQGKLAESIQVWEDGGRRVNAGPGFFAVFSTNPPGKGYQERFEVDKALARGLKWVNLPEQLSDESLRKAASQIFSCQDVPATAQTVVDISKSPELAAVIGDVMAAFHKAYSDTLKAGETGRRQKIPPTLDSLWRVAELMQEVQIPTADFKEIDLVKTLKRAVEGVYINCLEGKANPFDGAVNKEAVGVAMTETLEQLLSNRTTSLRSFRGRQKTPADIINTLAKEALRKEQTEAATTVSEVKQAVAVASNIQSITTRLQEMKNNLPENVFSTLREQALSSLSPNEKEQVLKTIGESNN